MITEKEFTEKYLSEIHVFEAWGRFVTKVILDAFNLLDIEINSVIKIAPCPRTKDVKSIIEKAFYRKNKKYENPYEEITDKVGTRFVVMLVEHIDIFSKIIVSKQELWEFSLDRDFEKEKNENPTQFVYQSKHYIVRNIEDITFEGVNIPKNTPCEIQLRTLLQHSYSELTHDTTYKPQIQATPEIKRLTAKSMALIETTDDIFTNVMYNINLLENKIELKLSDIIDLYKKMFDNKDYENKLNIYIWDAYYNTLKEVSLQQISDFISSHLFIKDKISEHANLFFIYKQPIIILLYYLVNFSGTRFLSIWPLTRNVIEPIYIDLGISIPEIHL